MVMRPEPWGAALDSLTAGHDRLPRLVVPTPAGVPMTQGLARELAADLQQIPFEVEPLRLDEPERGHVEVVVMDV